MKGGREAAICGQPLPALFPDCRLGFPPPYFFPLIPHSHSFCSGRFLTRKDFVGVVCALGGGLRARVCLHVWDSVCVYVREIDRQREREKEG